MSLQHGLPFRVLVRRRGRTDPSAIQVTPRYPSLFGYNYLSPSLSLCRSVPLFLTLYFSLSLSPSLSFNPFLTSYSWLYDSLFTTHSAPPMSHSLSPLVGLFSGYLYFSLSPSLSVTVTLPLFFLSLSVPLIPPPHFSPPFCPAHSLTLFPPWTP